MDDRPRFKDGLCTRFFACLCLPCAVVNTCVLQPLKLCCCFTCNSCLAFIPICCAWSVVPLVFLGVIVLLFIQTTQVEAFAALSILWDMIAIPADLFSQLAQIMWDTFILPVLLIYNALMDLFIRITIQVFDAFVGLFPSPFVSIESAALLTYTGGVFHTPHASRVYAALGPGSHAALAGTLPAPSVIVGGKYFVLVPPALFDLIVGNLLDAMNLIGDLLITIVEAVAAVGVLLVNKVVEGLVLALNAIVSGDVIEFITFVITTLISEMTAVWNMVWNAFASNVPVVGIFNQLINILLGVGQGALSQLPFVLGCISNPGGCGPLVSMITSMAESIGGAIADDIVGSIDFFPDIGGWL